MYTEVLIYYERDYVSFKSPVELIRFVLEIFCFRLLLHSGEVMKIGDQMKYEREREDKSEAAGVVFFLMTGFFGPDQGPIFSRKKNSTSRLAFLQNNFISFI